MKFTKLAIFATLLTMASTTFAATSAANTNTIAPTMKVTVTVQKAVSLTLATGTSASPTKHCAVNPGGGGDFNMDFGTVDALGINAGNCNAFAPLTPGASNAIYWSDYNLVPVYTSQDPVTTPAITAQVTTTSGLQSNVLIVRDSANSNAVPTGVGSFTAMGTGAADTIASGTAAIPGNGTAVTRFIGVSIAPTNGASMASAQSAIVTFTLTVN